MKWEVLQQVQLNLSRFEVVESQLVLQQVQLDLSSLTYPGLRRSLRFLEPFSFGNLLVSELFIIVSHDELLILLHARVFNSVTWLLCMDRLAGTLMLRVGSIFGGA
ncbi:hypothetical protein Tco_0371111 [Tanacetum coccineum]